MISKPKLNQPDVEITTTTIGESITINKTIPSKQFKDIFVTGTSIEKYAPNLEEVKKEWEDNGFEIISCSKERFEIYKNWIEKGMHTSAKVVIDKYLYIVGEFSNKYIQLLTKTFRAMERI